MIYFGAHSLFSRLIYSAVGLAIVATMALFGVFKLDAANKQNRRIAIYNIHTKETLDIVYMRDGKRIPSAMKRINWVMRDHRENKPTRMDPKLIDILWEIHTELGSREPIHLISGYRSAKTNAILRKTRGGQAKKSRHMLGKAADIHFPDVPIKRLRYSGLIRERGGVGYYPTSALPFVHIDTGRVRHWPRMPRYELALLFPNGRTLHRPKRGGPISKRDVHVARSRHKNLSRQVAAFFDSRGRAVPPRPVQVASATRDQFKTEVIFANSHNHDSAGQSSHKTHKPSKNVQLAALGPVVLPPAPRLLRENSQEERAHQAVLSASPRLAERPSRLEPKPSEADKRKLTELFTLAGLIPAAQQLFAQVTGSSSKEKAARPESVTASGDIKEVSPNLETEQSGLTIASLIAADQLALEQEPRLVSPSTREQVASLDPSFVDTPMAQTDMALNGPMDRFNWASGWVSAPAYDDEHPDELYYRPFPLAPLLTATSSPHDPALAVMTHPDVAGTLDFIDDTLAALPMKLRPNRRLAALMWSQHHFTSESGLNEWATEISQERDSPGTGVASRSVRTSVQ